MISSNLADSDPILNLNNLFDASTRNELREKVKILQSKNVADNLTLLNEIQQILKKCTHLTPEQKLMYCQSQRYFMKSYLREINRQL